MLYAAEYLFRVAILNPFQGSYFLRRANNLFRESQNSLRGANNKLLREVSRYVLLTTSFVLKYICVGNRGWTPHNKQYYVVWNNKNTLYIDEKLFVQLGFVLITTRVILLFCYLLFY